MAPFTQALRSFRAGSLSQDELLAEIHRQLAVEKVAPSSLLDALKIQQFAEPLPRDVHEALVNRIVNWPQDPTVITGEDESPRVERSNGPQAGDTLQGRFNLVELVGEGGMSRVFKAIDLRRVEAGADDPYVAVKVLSEPLSDYFGSITALQREAHKLQNLAHPNIVRVIDCDRDGEFVFMTLEYLAGDSLQKKLRLAGQGGIEAAAGRSIVSQVGSALQYAHEHRIVHGDLKPGNVIIAQAGAVKVIDFGMAHFVVDPPAGADKIPRAVTARYASPELLAGATPKPTDDVYALACIAYETLTGRHPFGRRGEAGARDLRSPPPRLAQLKPHEYTALVKALAFNGHERTATVAQFLREFAEPVGKTRWNLWAAIAAVCCLIAVLVLLALPRSRSPSPSVPAASVSVSPTPSSDSLLTPGSAIRDCPTCPLMTLLPAGRFAQGADSGDAELLPMEQPRHEVIIGAAFAMSANEITVAEFRQFVEATQRPLSGCNTYDGRWQFEAEASWESPGFAQTPLNPVICTSWNDAVAYAAWLSKKSSKTYRLPSASEWEYAARAGADDGQPWGADSAAACEYANVADRSALQRYPGWNAFSCSDGYANTAPVGSFRANAFGLNDMLGNAFEWVQDCWHGDYVGAPTDGSARMDADCREHELRGGSWFSSPRFVSAPYRNRFEADYRSSSVGFRLVREVSP